MFLLAGILALTGCQNLSPIEERLNALETQHTQQATQIETAMDLIDSVTESASNIAAVQQSQDQDIATNRLALADAASKHVETSALVGTVQEGLAAIEGQLTRSEEALTRQKETLERVQEQVDQSATGLTGLSDTVDQLRDVTAAAEGDTNRLANGFCEIDYHTITLRAVLGYLLVETGKPQHLRFRKLSANELADITFDGVANDYYNEDEDTHCLRKKNGTFELLNPDEEDGEAQEEPG